MATRKRWTPCSTTRMWPPSASSAPRASPALPTATATVMGAAYGSAGERCMAISVAVAVGKAGDALIERLLPRVRGLKVGPGTDPESEMGPLVTKTHLDKVKSYVDLGV